MIADMVFGARWRGAWGSWLGCVLREPLFSTSLVTLAIVRHYSSFDHVQGAASQHRNAPATHSHSLVW